MSQFTTCREWQGGDKTRHTPLVPRQGRIEKPSCLEGTANGKCVFDIPDSYTRSEGKLRIFFRFQILALPFLVICNWYVITSLSLGFCSIQSSHTTIHNWVTSKFEIAHVAVSYFSMSATYIFYILTKVFNSFETKIGNFFPCVTGDTFLEKQRNDFC